MPALARGAARSAQPQTPVASPRTTGPDASNSAALAAMGPAVETQGMSSPLLEAAMERAPAADSGAYDWAEDGPEEAVAAPAAQVSGRVELGVGSVGPQVVALQQALVRHGHRVAVDGDFGGGTRGAVLAFQRTNGLGVDGVVGPATAAALNRAPRGARPVGPAAATPAVVAPGAAGQVDGSAPLSIGQNGPSVRTLQSALVRLGATLTVDGDFGPGTHAVVVHYQRGHGLSADGVVGPATAALINRGARVPAGPVAPPALGTSREGYNAEVGAAVARAALRRAGSRSTGWCYKFVADAVAAGMGFDLSGGHAYMAAAQLAGRRDLFTEVGASGLSRLPAGAIVVWGKGSSASGHISIAAGDGREVSDYVGPQMTSHYGGAGARVFLPKKRA